MSPVLVGRRMVLDSLARLEKADTYCSATVREAAAFPFCTVHNKMIRMNGEISNHVYLVKKNNSQSSPAESEPPTERGSPSILPPL